VTVGQLAPRPAAVVAPSTLPDGLMWPVALSVLSYGVRVGVRTNVPDLAEVLVRHLPPGAEVEEFSEKGRVYSLLAQVDERSGREWNSVYVDGARVVCCSTLPTALRALEANVQLHVAEMAPDRVFVHAGVVGYRGRGILLPGRSFAGKTTLVAELVRAGLEYYSDEYAVLDAGGNVHPYARALSIREVGGAGVTKQPIHALGGHAGRDPLPVGLVVVTRFRSGAEWRPKHVTGGRGVLALLANTVPARRRPDVVLGTLGQVVATARVVISNERGEANGVVEAILELATRS